MPVFAKAPIGDYPWLLADWIEFQVLSSEFSVFRLYRITRISDEDQEEENEDFVAQDTINEEILSEVIKEIDNRIKALGTCYPFKFSEDNTELELVKKQNNFTPGSVVYLYCLFFSHVNRNDVILPDPPSDSHDRDLMQVCATLAAAGEINGNAISFGFPRPDHTGFLSALKSAYERIGEGKVKEYIPRGASAYEKDGGVDIIAWCDTPDNAPGRTYILGQVASGQNWREKSIIGKTDSFHKTWFEEIPASRPVPAMYIPFCLDEYPDHLVNKIQYDSYKFGTLVYRYRLPVYAERGYVRATEQPTAHIDRFNDFDNLRAYVETFLSNELCDQA